jgi:hypothetical protein
MVGLYSMVLLLLLSPFSQGGSYTMDHNRFYDMPQAQRVWVVKKRMELMVEMEAKNELAHYSLRDGYEKNSSEGGVKWARPLNFKLLEELLISGAHASEAPVNLVNISKDFETALTQVTRPCLYSGYVSEMQGGYCIHPKRSKNKMILKAYYDPRKKCKYPTEISCNPMVFGYQKAADETPLCVPTGPTKDNRNKAHNVSYACMQKSIYGQGDKETDTPEERLKYLTEQMQASTALFETIHRPIFRLCACGESGEIDKQYFKYMRPHRTCFGLMKGLWHMNSQQCSSLKNKTIDEKYKSFAQKFNQFFEMNEELDYPKTAGPETFDKKFKEIIESQDMKAFCSQPSGPVKTEDDKPKEDDDKPKDDDDKPKDDDDQPKPEDDQPKPEDDQPKPEDDKPKPEDDKPKPEDDQPKPEDDQPKEDDDKPKDTPPPPTPLPVPDVAPTRQFTPPLQFNTSTPGIP